MENTCFGWRRIENTTQTQMLRRNRWQTQGKHKCCVGYCEKLKGNTNVAWEPIENKKKTHVLRCDILKTQGKHECCMGTH